jgi:hypothetical protein
MPKPEHYNSDEVKQLIAIVYILAQRNGGKVEITEDEFCDLPETERIAIKVPMKKSLFKTTEFPCTYTVSTY